MDATDAFAEARAAHQASGTAVRTTLAAIGRLLLIAILIAGTLRVVLVQPVHISSGSMRPLLGAGDFLFVNKAAYGWSAASLPAPIASALPAGGRIAGKLPQRGDIVLFAASGAVRPGYVKRVVGLPGDRIALVSGRVRLNGTLLPCTPRNDDLCRETLPGGPSYLVRESGQSPLSTFPEQEVPHGHIFVLGDNRVESADSRLSPEQGGAGMVPLSRLIGRARHVGFAVGPDGVRIVRIGAPAR
jgi:signal peptidase I